MKLVTVLLAAWAVSSLSAQNAQTGTAPVAFEVASIRLNKDGGLVAGIRRFPGGRFEAINIQLAALISFAHQLQPFELQGGPPWLMSDRWDIVARVDGDPPPLPPGSQTPDAMMLATRALLSDRFRLTMHGETRDIEVYRLVMAREDGRPGPALRRSTYDCAGLPLAQDEAAKRGLTAPNPNTPDRLVCGMRVGIGRIQFGGRPLSFLTNTLTAMTERRVVEATGLAGDWEFDISFSPPAPQQGIDAPLDNLNAASLFTVLQERLGLKLQSSRMPMPVMVIDRVERPLVD